MTRTVEVTRAAEVDETTGMFDVSPLKRYGLVDILAGC